MQLTTGRRIKTIQADWGGEFKNRTLNSWCKTKGIVQKETVAYHSETNAIVQEYGILPHSRTYYCLLFSLYHMFIVFVISY